SVYWMVIASRAPSCFHSARLGAPRLDQELPMQAAHVRRVSCYWAWIGGIYSSPSHRVFHLINSKGRFLRQDSARDEPEPIDTRLVAEFLAALRSPSIQSLDLGRMGLTAAWFLGQAPAVIEARCRELPPEQASRLAHEGLAVLKARPDLEDALRK